MPSGIYKYGPLNTKPTFAKPFRDISYTFAKKHISWDHVFVHGWFRMFHASAWSFHGSAWMFYEKRFS